MAAALAARRALLCGCFFGSNAFLAEMPGLAFLPQVLPTLFHHQRCAGPIREWNFYRKHWCFGLVWTLHCTLKYHEDKPKMAISLSSDAGMLLLLSFSFLLAVANWRNGWLKLVENMFCGFLSYVGALCSPVHTPLVDLEQTEGVGGGWRGCHRHKGLRVVTAFGTQPPMLGGHTLASCQDTIDTSCGTLGARWWRWLQFWQSGKLCRRHLYWRLSQFSDWREITLFSNLNLFHLLSGLMKSLSRSFMLSPLPLSAAAAAVELVESSIDFQGLLEILQRGRGI